MEVTARKDLRALLPEHERVVGGRIQLDLRRPPCVHGHVSDRSVHLRHASKRVGILYPTPFRAPQQPRSPEDRPQVSGTVDLSRMGTQFVDPRIEGLSRPGQSLQTHTPHHVRDAYRVLRLHRS